MSGVSHVQREVRLRRAIAGALFLGTVLLFSRVIDRDFGFVNYDDPDYVTTNRVVQQGLTMAGVKWAFTTGAVSNWHPLTWVSHQLDWSLFCGDARGHHATSVVWHALNAALAFAALRRLTGALWTSAFCAALFAWHPLRVESVAWVAERKDVLSGFFWFATLWAYAVYQERRRTAGRGAGWFYGLALTTLALGLLAKPMLVTLPAVLLLLDFWPTRRFAAETTRGLLLEKLPFFALAAASCVVTYSVQRDGGAVSLALSFSGRLSNAVVAVVRYVGSFLWPFDLAVLYPHPGYWPAKKVAASLAIVAALTAVAWVRRRRQPYLAVGWLWFLGTLVPVIGLVQVGLQSMADRYTYVTMFGLHVAGLWALRAAVVTPAARRVGGLVGVGLLAAGAIRTWDQQGVWKNSLTLFDHAIAVTERNYLAFNNRGIYLCEVGRVEEGMADYRRALAIRADYPEANNNLARMLGQQGRSGEAVPMLRVAVRGKPDSLEARNNLANALSDTGAVAEAMEQYAFILEREPQHVDALTNSGVALAMQGKVDEARLRMEAALRVAPNNLSALSNLGNVYALLGRRDEAITQYRRTIALSPGDARAHHNLGNALGEAGQWAEAAASYARAVVAAPANAESRAHLGLAYARLGRREEALRELRAASAQQPDYAAAKAWLQAVEDSK